MISIEEKLKALVARRVKELLSDPDELENVVYEELDGLDNDTLHIMYKLKIDPEIDEDA